MRLYRICPEAYLKDLSILGGSYRDGARWNSPGYPVLYFALSASTALLEMANYIPSPRLVPPSYMTSGMCASRGRRVTPARINEKGFSHGGHHERRGRKR
jgi:hypothetical protein